MSTVNLFSSGKIKKLWKELERPAFFQMLPSTETGYEALCINNYTTLSWPIILV
jgi:hypothetical protein